MARNLRVLLIADRPVTDLESRHLDLQRVPYGTRDELDPSLGTWYQHLRMWSDNLFPSDDPDLVLIDCRFEGDSSHVPQSDELRENDPRGLLHEPSTSPECSGGIVFIRSVSPSTAWTLPASRMTPTLKR